MREGGDNLDVLGIMETKEEGLGEMETGHLLIYKEVGTAKQKKNEQDVSLIRNIKIYK